MVAFQDPKKTQGKHGGEDWGEGALKMVQKKGGQLFQYRLKKEKL